MKSIGLASTVLATSLAIATPSLVFAHVGHGDEFQAEGGINRVQVNPQTDAIMGIEVTPIEPAADGNAVVLIPVTAVVDADGNQIVFVQYENFYEPVPVTTGTTQGELIEVTAGLAVGEKLVTQGSLSLYAESRKTQTVESAASKPEAASPQTMVSHAEADAQGIPHSHDGSGNLVESGQTAAATSETDGFPVGKVAIGAGVLAVVSGGFVLLNGPRRKKRNFSSKRGSF